MMSYCTRVLLVAFCVIGTSTHAIGQKPNIIFIMADDLGWTDIGCQGSKYYETPAIDKLAAQGMRFTSYYHCQNCAPSRAALMSGQYPPRTGIYTVGTLERGNADARKMNVPANVTQLPLDRTTMANVMHGAGYTTGLFGKWHLGQMGDYHPSKRGFDEAITSMGRHFDFVTQPKVDYPKGAYLADWLTDKAVAFIDKHKEKPFFLCVHHFGVHVPHEAKPDLIEKYKKKKGVGGHNDPVYAAMIDSVDQSVGRIVAKLDELKLSDNTLVIFVSDNGGVGGYNREGIPARNATDNAPLRSGKGSLYEGGVRVPFIVKWPKVIKASATCDTPAQHVDMLPTFADIGGASLPKQPLDGESILPLIKEPTAKLKREAIYAHFPGYLEGGGAGQWRTTPVAFIRSGDWKLLEFFETSKIELYNLKEDIGEKKDLSKEMPDKMKELHGKMLAWRGEIKAAMPKAKK
jgi:arylsulfatase A-like enzyme